MQIKSTINHLAATQASNIGTSLEHLFSCDKETCCYAINVLHVKLDSGYKKNTLLNLSTASKKNARSRSHVVTDTLLLQEERVKK